MGTRRWQFALGDLLERRALGEPRPSNFPGVRGEQLVAVLLEAADQRLALGADQEVGERPRAVGVDARGLHLDDVVRVRERRIAPDRHREPDVPHREERARVGERIAALLAGHRQRRAHPLAGLDVPLPAELHPGLLPQLLLLLVGARVVAAGDEHRLLLRDPLQRVGRGRALGAGRVVERPHEEEGVAHHGEAARAAPRGHQLLLGGRGVHEQRVGHALAPHGERLARADRDRLHLVPALAFEHRHDRVEQPGVDGARRGREDDRALRNIAHRGRPRLLGATGERRQQRGERDEGGAGDRDLSRSCLHPVTSWQRFENAHPYLLDALCPVKHIDKRREKRNGKNVSDDSGSLARAMGVRLGDKGTLFCICRLVSAPRRCRARCRASVCFRRTQGK
jgi:hypothetical protein